MTLWFLYGIIVLISFGFFWISILRAKEHLNKYPLRKQDDLHLFFGGSRKRLFVLYFSCLLMVTVLFGFFFSLS